MSNLPKAFQKINFEFEKEEQSATYGKFVISPLERGFGLTIGNALRRVLLSALPGGAVHSVDIDGARHEFTALKGVEEDVVGIVLNIKNLILNIDDDSEEDKKLTIDKTGPCTVYAKDIVCPSLVSVVNGDLEIAHLAEGGHLRMTMYANCGRGFVTAEINRILSNTSEQINGRIDVDSNYSPVTKVSYSIEGARVKHDSNFDKLILEVWTNGSIRPIDAVCNASNILIQHFNLIANMESESLKAVEFKEEEKEENVEENKVNNTPIEDLDLTQRSYNCLRRAGINNVFELTQKTEDEIAHLKNLGKRSLQEIKGKLQGLNLSFRDYSSNNDGGNN